MVAFRKECRAYATHWLNVQREEFKRLGIIGDWDHPYATMDYAAEAQIARELMKFAANGTLYRGSKPVMWSVVEKTALAEAEVEYEDYTSRYGVGEISGDVAGAWRAGQRQRRDLDHDAVDAARQPRHQLLAEDRLWPLQGHRCARRQLGEERRSPDPRGRAGRRRVQAGARHRIQEGSRDPGRHDGCGGVRASAERFCRRLRIHRAASGRRSRHRRHRHRLRPHRARPRPRGLRRLDGAMRASWKRAASTPRFPTPSTRTAPSPIMRRASPENASSTTRAKRATPTRP